MVRKKCRAAVKLDEILKKGGPMANALKCRFHRTILSRARNGHRKVSGQSMLDMAQITKGRIAPPDWR